MVSVAVSKLDKTDLMFVQPGAKINSVYECHNVLEQGLLPDIRPFIEWWFAFSAGRSAGTPFTPHCRLPAFPWNRIHWTGKLAAKQSRSKSCGLFSVGALQQIVYRHKISHWLVLIDWWAQLSQNMLNRAIDQLWKRLMMVTKVKGAHVEVHLD